MKEHNTFSTHVILYFPQNYRHRPQHSARLRVLTFYHRSENSKQLVSSPPTATIQFAHEHRLFSFVESQSLQNALFLINLHQSSIPFRLSHHFHGHLGPCLRGFGHLQVVCPRVRLVHDHTIFNLRGPRPFKPRLRNNQQHNPLLGSCQHQP